MENKQIKSKLTVHRQVSFSNLLIKMSKKKPRIEFKLNFPENDIMKSKNT